MKRKSAFSPVQEEGLEEGIDEDRRQYPESDHVGQRIELFPCFAIGIQHACSKTIQKIQNRGYQYQVNSPMPLSFQSQHNGTVVPKARFSRVRRLGRWRFIFLRRLCLSFKIFQGKANCQVGDQIMKGQLRYPMIAPKYIMKVIRL